ncbi:unnamed protein product [Paramecium pentaurelia]|uniref:Uncharacterized protein n=1 Tax=Paramecium pentaurelia TaxID=43138 RepID=A0A8S1UFV8_9CILI|nr:unnamed protein product [Paramecium pentaurelia]
MGVCASSQKKSQRQIGEREVCFVLESLTQESQVNEVYKTLIGQTQIVFENLIKNKIISRNISQTEYDFYSKQTEELSMLNNYLQNYYNNYYRIVVSNIKSENLYYFQNLNLKFIIQLYLAMKSIKYNGNEWWNSQTFYSLEKLITNRFNIFPKVVEEGRITPFINFILLLMKLSIKLMNLEGMTLQEKEIEIIVDTKGINLYNQIKLDLLI